MQMLWFGHRRGCLRRPNAVDLLTSTRSRDIRPVADRVRKATRARASIPIPSVGRAQVRRPAAHRATTATAHLLALATALAGLLRRATAATATELSGIELSIIGDESSTRSCRNVLNRGILSTRRSETRLGPGYEPGEIATLHLPTLLDRTTATTAHKRSTSTASRHLLFGRKKYPQRPRLLVVCLPPSNRSQDRHLVVGEQRSQCRHVNPPKQFVEHGASLGIRVRFKQILSIEPPNVTDQKDVGGQLRHTQDRVREHPLVHHHLEWSHLLGVIHKEGDTRSIRLPR